MKSLILSIVVVIGLVDTVSAQPFWSVGPKVGYTFGENGGTTGGFEVSYFPRQDFPYVGFTFDFTAWKDYVTLHFGIEGNEIIGIDVGPTLFFSKGNVDLGLSAIPFGGIMLFGYYELAWPFFKTPFQSCGGYFKIPIGMKLDLVG
jgi:hypothetical protein